MEYLQGIASSTMDTIGRTPLVRLNRVTEGLHAEILLKCEFRNPLFSIKDRVALSMVRDAEARGVLPPGGLMIEPTSGNTGIGLAFVARQLGYRCLLVMPETMSVERRALLAMLGAEIVLTPASLGMQGSIDQAERLKQRFGDEAFIPGQFTNPANPLAHYLGTGREIVEQTDAQVDVFVAGIGTGGTITGIGRRLKESIPGVRIVGGEPAESAVLSGGKPGPHLIQGIGAGFIPKILDGSLLDDVLPVPGQEAVDMARRINAVEGIPVGISTGGNVYAAMQLARLPEMRGKRIVTVASSAVERYMSTILVQDVRERVAQLPVSF